MGLNKTPAIGTRAGRWSERAELRRETVKMLTDQIEKGLQNPWWGEGAFVRHVALGLFVSISLCGRHLGAVNSSPMPTLIGVPCRKCMRIWNRTMTAYNVEAELRAQDVIAEKAHLFTDLILTGEGARVIEEWNALYELMALRDAVVDRLKDKGIDLRAKVTSYRDELGVPRVVVNPNGTASVKFNKKSR